MKDYVVCEEMIKGQYGLYSIRDKNDCSHNRFKILADFDTYEEADDYIDYLRNPEDYFNLDE